MTGHSRHRFRFRIAFVVILTLLFQQVALAAYACTLTQPPTEPSAMPGCAEMSMPAKAPPPPALCQKHCTPDQSIAADHVPPTVPALALPPLLFAPLFDQSISHVALVAAVPIARSDPPPRLRYCSLLI
jgi:hypothetical protein